MATDFHVPNDELRHRLQASRRHWETEGETGAPLVMPGSDLRRFDLREQILVGAQLQGADLRGSLLDSALLIRAALDGARMAGASLFSTDASRATLMEAELAGAQAPLSSWRRATLTRADLTGARLDDSDFRGADLIGARLDRASLVRSNLGQTVLLNASFREADLSDASLQGAAADPRTFTGAIGSPVGEPTVGFQATPRRRSAFDRDFEATVRDFLRQRGVQVMWGFDPGPDLVLELPGETFAALEVSGSTDRDRLFRLAERADLILVPDDAKVRSAMNNTPVSQLREAEGAIRSLQPSRLKPYAASALAARQADRLRPYFLLANQALTDPSLLSRLSVYLDTRQPLMLNASDRAIADRLPAHLDGNMAARAASWAAEHREKLRDLQAQGASIRQGAKVSTQPATDLARLGSRLEQELAAIIGAES